MTPQQAATLWQEAAARAGRNYMTAPTPEERLDSLKRAYVAGSITFETFDRALTPLVAALR